MKTDECVQGNSEKMLFGATGSIVDILIIGLTLANIFESIVSEESVTYMYCLFASKKNACQFLEICDLLLALNSLGRIKQASSFICLCLACGKR